MTLSLPAWSIEIGWSTSLTGLFRLAVSALNSGDTLSGFFGGTTYDDMTGEVYGFRSERGRDSGGTLRKGTAELWVDDPTGKYNPDNAASVLYGNLLPLRPVRIRATHSGTTYGVWYGFTERIEHDPARAAQQTTIFCVDLLDWLENARPTIAATGATTTGGAIGKVLDAIAWDASSLRDLDLGDTLSDFSADGTKNGATLIEELLTAERGWFFVDGDGKAVYVDRDARYLAISGPTTISSSYLSGVRPTVDLRTIINRQKVTKTGNTAQTASDATSIARYGYRDGAAIESAYLADDTQAAALASHIVAVSKDGRSRAFGIRLVGLDDANLANQLGLELGDAIAVSEDGGGTAFTGTIESVRQELRGATLVTEYWGNKQTVSLFRIAASALNSGDVLAY